ncbi:MAG: hypothetical protein JRJ47_14990 [Deltaproteobacteria bacterium]|nr:hypothetical protein [Deltaproteobacteria bacterium]
MPTAVLVAMALFVWVLSCGNVAVAFDFHADSAHGNQSDGVNRIDTECPPGTPCPTGDCVHCHDTFDSSTCDVNHLMLFNEGFINQKSGVCMKCHQEIASHQDGGLLNYDYSVVRGGESKDCPASIRKQFWFIKYDTRLPRIHCDLTEPIGSAHDLKDIRAYMKNKWGWGDTNIEVNPCGTCHNPHKSTNDYPCSLPSSHSNTWDVWGDGNGEKMADYASGLSGVYQPPQKVGGGFEWIDDNQAPDYNTLCMDCHSGPITDNFTYRWDRDLVSLAWFEQNSSTTGWHGNRHGAEDRKTTGDRGTLKSPYNDDENTNYILMCTDCHEPHGSKNYMLLRTCVNGTGGLTLPSTGATAENWMTWCEACHTMTERENHMESPFGSPCDSSECHHHYTYIEHGKF